MQRRSFLKALLGLGAAALIPQEMILAAGKEIFGVKSREYTILKQKALESHAIEMERALLFGWRDPRANDPWKK